MNLLSCLADILSSFRRLFNLQNFALFPSDDLWNLVANTHGGTLTRLYQSSFAETKSWSWTKFLSRGVWDADTVAARLVEKGQEVFTHWVYVYDLTSAVQTGKKCCPNR